MRVENTQQVKCVQSVCAEQNVCKAQGVARLPVLRSQLELDAAASHSNMSSKLAAVAGYILSGAHSTKLMAFHAMPR